MGSERQGIRRNGAAFARYAGAAGAFCAAAVLLASACIARAEWLTARGNPERTGCLDRRPGPRKPKVLWAYKAKEHFIGPPVPFLQRLYVPGLGAFNTGTFHCFSLETDAERRLLWSKAAPFLKRPTVSSPAVTDGLVIFGDGMHQTDDAILYCLRAETGRLVWQYPVPGKLVHLEGAPLIYGDRVYIGGGDAGVISVYLKQMTLEGKDYDLETVNTLLETRWKDLLAKYEQEKKKDPDFAIPPSEDSLPKPAPKLYWQAGKGAWHVDAPLVMARGRLLVASAYLDVEKHGKRALIALRSSGKPAWEVPLKYNPWAGASVADDYTALVGCSSIRYERNRIGEAKGEVVAIRASSSAGQVRWRKELPGGVLSTIACAKGLAVFTATDGKVRAWAVSSGEEKWLYDCGAPLFAGPAVARDTVYVADLKGVVHAIDLALGKKLWSLKVSADPLVQVPGMVFGSPVVHGGRVYVATCNVEGEHTDQPCAVICIADETVMAAERAAVVVGVDKAKRTVTVPCRVAPRKLPHLKESYPLEVVATYPHPRGQKAHETVITILAKPSDVHKALEGLGLKPGKPVKGAEGAPTGPEVRLSLAFPGASGGENVLPIERAMADRRTGRPLAPIRWFFTGSAMKQPDPEKPVVVYGADFTGTLICLYPISDYTVLQSNLTMQEETLLKLDTNKIALPQEHTAGKLIIEVAPPSAAGQPAAPPETAAPAALEFGPLPPQFTAPAKAAVPVLVAMSAEARLRPAEAHLRPRPLATDRLRPPTFPPIAGRPPLASCTAPLTAKPVPLAAGPLARAESPDLRRMPAIAMYPRPYSGRLQPADDPTEAPGRAVLLSTRSTGRQTVAPFIRIAIPDPFEQINALRLRACPPDDDPADHDANLPETPKFAVEKKP